MSAAKNEMKEPSYNLMVLGGLSMLVVGGVLGFICLLVQRPVALNSEKELAAYLQKQSKYQGPTYQAYYFKGPVERTQDWAQKREQLLAAATQKVEFSDGDLNAWFTARFRPALPGPGQKKPALVPGVPNIFLSEQSVCLSLPLDVEIAGSKKKWVVFVQGNFVGEERPRFLIESLHVNNAALPFASTLGQSVLNGLIEAYRAAPDYEPLLAAWERVESIQVVANRMQIQMR